MHNRDLKIFAAGILNSYTMIFFSKNMVFGIILVLVSFFDLFAGTAGILAVIISNAFAMLLGLNKKKISEGLYGFNALLVGLGMGLAIQPSPAFYVILIFITLTTLLVTLAFEGVIGKYGLSYLTLPFLFSIWLAIIATRGYSSLSIGESGIFTLNTMYLRGGKIFMDMYLWFDDLNWPVYLKTYFKSLGAIIFQYHLLSGILIAIGLLLYSRIAFIYSIAGFTAAWLFYLVIGADIHELDYSYIGFNHILTAIAIGSFFTIASGWSLMWVVLITPLVSMITSAAIQVLGIYQLPVYSLPFNMVVLMFLYALKFRERINAGPELVYIQHYSPEKNLYANVNAHARFRNKWYIPLSLPFFGFRHINQAHNGDVTHKDEWKHAWDFIIRDEKGKEYENDGTALTDYYGFNKPVLAPADGWIQEVTDHLDDNIPGSYNMIQNWGNTIVIKHAEQLYTKVSHLKKGSALYPKGTFVQKGQVIAQSGNSGRSPYPHLHFQVQANPYIGSATVNYPISQYICINGSYKLKMYEIPGINEEVSNIHPDNALEKSFRFIPGQVIEFTLSDGGEGHWDVLTDIYNNTYLYCAASNSTAWLKTEGKLFYFTHFEGDRNSMLFYFFISLYQVSLGYYKDLELRDVFPPTILPYSTLRMIQDFIAPFVLFIKPQYLMTFAKRDEDIAGNTITIRTQTRYSFMTKSLIDLEAFLTVTDNGLKQLDIKMPNKKYSLTFIKQS